MEISKLNKQTEDVPRAFIVQKSWQFCCIIAVATLVGCATARTVTVQPGAGGVIAIAPQDSSEARGKAINLMQINCSGRRWKIVQEGESVVGSTSSASSSPTKNLFTGKDTGSTSTSTETSNKTEWRLKYVCLKK